MAFNIIKTLLEIKCIKFSCKQSDNLAIHTNEDWAWRYIYKSLNQWQELISHFV